jgi:hypothetical protein
MGEPLFSTTQDHDSILELPKQISSHGLLWVLLGVFLEIGPLRE